MTKTIRGNTVFFKQLAYIFFVKSIFNCKFIKPLTPLCVFLAKDEELRTGGRMCEE